MLLPVSSVQVNAASPVYLTNRGTTAVDVKGIRHNGNDYPQQHPPWLDDRSKAVGPSYPCQERARNHEGSGLFGLMLDLRSGAVSSVRVISSTGFATLDQCALTAFRQWRFRPGKWKEIDLPVTF
ncbi:MAG: energy transducer TonB [Verrucomicrobia bacterium]|nr:energy transducer TonB [Verrucomicrobiota bacterium]